MNIELMCALLNCDYVNDDVFPAQTFFWIDTKQMEV